MLDYKAKKSQIPIIDLDDAYQGQAMITACLEHGFFYVDNRQGQVVNLEVIDELQRKSQEFFRLSVEDKNKYAIEKSISLTGYAGFEAMTNFVPHANEIYVIHADSLFPSIQEEQSFKYNFDPELTNYIKSCLDINKKIYKHLNPYLNFKNVRNSNGFLKNWADGFHDCLWTGRFLHYPPNGGTIAPHNDVGLLTILNQDQTGGLQVWFKEQWIDVAPIPNTFVVNVGEMLQSWSSGLLKSTRHRVINTKEIDRYSMTFLPLFDKTCEVYIEEENEWKYPYNHLVERYYTIYKHLSKNAQNSINWLQGKSPDEVEDFHQKAFLSTTKTPTNF
ncbi:MAG: 2OG-Fe(II) oxygenase family protein [Candidatus Paracaedibacteraceae bacterium]|nr:2OG-Fe(II) oxygenase family protein [Candidatus Paracaedibacteraceae bacterium]